MIEPEPLDFAKVESVCWRALCQHQVSEREMVVAATVIRLSFVIGRPFVELGAQMELARITGLTKGNVGDMVTRLISGGALCVSADRRIYTFLPPSRNWPWAFRRRIDDEEARAQSERLELSIVHANLAWPQQPELAHLQPEREFDREFEEATAIERMRLSLLEFHARATENGRTDFPVTDRLPRHAPAAEPGSVEGPSRPLETGSAQSPAPEPVILKTGGPKGSEIADQPRDDGSRIGYAEDPERRNGTRIGYPAVPDSGTQHINALISAPYKGADINAYMEPVPESGTEERRSYVADEASNVDEEERSLILELLGAMGPADHRPGCKCGQGMCRHGGWWRLRIRESAVSRMAVQAVLRDLRLRVRDRLLAPVRNRGGWLRFEYLKLRKAMEANLQLRRDFEASKAETSEVPKSS